MPRTGAFAKILLLTLVWAGLLALSGLLAQIAQPDHLIPPVWPITGFALVLLWLGPRTAPISVFLGQFAYSLWDGGSAPLAGLAAVITTATAFIMHRAIAGLGIRQNFEQVRDVVGLTIVAMVVSLLPATAFAVIVLTTFPGPGIGGNVFFYWLGDVLSYLIIVPLVAVWRRWPPVAQQQLRDVLLICLGMAAVGVAMLLSGERIWTDLLFLLLPFVIAGSVRGEMAGASATGFLLAVLLLAVNSQIEPGTLPTAVRVGFVAVAALTGYVLAAVWRERRRLTARQAWRADHDLITGLPNRQRFEREVEKAGAAAGNSRHALLVIDLDRFRLVNDTCGHTVGDRMLSALAKVLRDSLPTSAMLARLGGDEFGVLLPDTDATEAERAVREIREGIGAFEFRHEDMRFSLEATIGTTRFPGEPGEHPQEAIGRADFACHTAKQNGRGRVHAYDPVDTMMLRRHQTIRDLSQLNAALESGCFELHSQPVVRVEDGSVAFEEVLLRMNDSSGLRTPGEFLPMAQRFGLTTRIDRWVLEQAAKRLAAQPASAMLSVNVTGSTVDDPAFFDFVSELPKRFGFEAERLCLEVTETSALEHLRMAVGQLTRLRAMGFSIALDDFGSGVASFGYLQELPVTHVKLDGHLVRDLMTSDDSRIIITALVELARLRDIEVVAEWVEDKGTLDELGRMGIRLAQGFLLGRPAPLGA